MKRDGRMKKRMMSVALVVAMTASLLTGCGTKTADTESAKSDKKVLRVGMECAYPPFNWTQDENDTFTGDDEMVNVCIATKLNDTKLKDQIQDAMTSLGWNDKEKMDELMTQVLTQQPAAN